MTQPRKIGLYDVDSLIPNLALMKIAAFHKALGDSVEAYVPLMKSQYDLIYASKVFSFSDGAMLDPERMIIGGTGYPGGTDLAPEIDRMAPDYSIYDYPHSIGFTMRGCRLKCSFCVVPEKEGRPRGDSTIPEIWTQRESDFIVLLDNDFFGNPEWERRIDEVLEFDLQVNFSQGLNIRNLKPEQAAAIASVRFRNLKGTKKQVHFAWDDPRHEKLIHKGITTAIDAGLKPHQMAFYVLIGYHSTPAEDLHRIETLRAYGVDPFVMPYDRTDFYQASFARYVNRKAVFNRVSWEEYRTEIRPKPTSEYQGDLWLG